MGILSAVSSHDDQKTLSSREWTLPDLKNHDCSMQCHRNAEVEFNQKSKGGRHSPWLQRQSSYS